MNSPLDHGAPPPKEQYAAGVTENYIFRLALRITPEELTGEPPC
jgi:hypothetical protein